MKYVNIAFDDARSDTYTRAFPVLNKYSFTGTINVITEFVNNNSLYDFKSAKRSMSMAEIRECQLAGIEIASHGHSHQNNARDINYSIKELYGGGVCISNIGFASPHSWLTDENINGAGIQNLLDEGKISYVRSGVQIRREGRAYMALSAIEMLTHSKFLFLQLNRKNIIKEGKAPNILGSVAVKSYTTIQQLIYLIDSMSDTDSVCILFHSILNDRDEGYGKDYYYWDVAKFELFCQYLNSLEDVKVCTTYEIAQRWQ